MNDCVDYAYTNLTLCLLSLHITFLLSCEANCTILYFLDRLCSIFTEKNLSFYFKE